MSIRLMQNSTPSLAGVNNPVCQAQIDAQAAGHMQDTDTTPDIWP